MSTTSIAPEVARFATAVRAQLSDLTDDEREELVGGLEADLSDLVAERGTGALGDPVAYAHELRSAAGLGPRPGRTGQRPPLLEVVGERLDLARQRCEQTFAGLPGDPWGVAVSLRPAWWLLRAYVAVQTLDILFGDGSWRMGWVPTLLDHTLSLVLLALAALVSVQLGRGRLWPRASGSVPQRLVLLALNVFAVVMTVPVFGSLPHLTYEQASGYGGYVPAPRGVTNDGGDVTNVFAYDAEGEPLTGVQLFDQYGQPLAVDPGLSDQHVEWAYPWTNVNGEVWNTFPMPVGEGDPDLAERRPSPWTSETPPTFPRPPLDRVPSVTIPDAAYGEDGPPQEAEPQAAPERRSGDKSAPGPRR